MTNYFLVCSSSVQTLHFQWFKMCSDSNTFCKFCVLEVTPQADKKHSSNQTTSHMTHGSHVVFDKNPTCLVQMKCRPTLQNLNKYIFLKKWPEPVNLVLIKCFAVLAAQSSFKNFHRCLWICFFGLSWFALLFPPFLPFMPSKHTWLFLFQAVHVSKTNTLWKANRLSFHYISVHTPCVASHVSYIQYIYPSCRLGVSECLT